MVLKWLCIILCCVFFEAAVALVYQSEANGNVEFSDVPARTEVPVQTEMSARTDVPLQTPTPIQTHTSPTLLPIPYSKSDPKHIKQQQKNVEKNVKQYKKIETKQQRIKQRAAKQKLKVEAKEKRRQAHCLLAKEKIKTIEDALRQGGSLKRFNRLKTELEHHERMKQKYCELQ